VGRANVTVPEGGGCVYVVATPIGNLDDASPRAIAVLREVDVIACEDTRRTARLCSRFDVKTERVSLHAHNEEQRVPGLLRRLGAGESIALVSDAGTPLLSDPGRRLVSAAWEAGFRVIPVPGPSAVLAALVSSGFVTQPFTFLGFPPRKGGPRARWLERLASLPGSIVLFESPRRVAQTLRDLHAALGPRRVAVARELTKRFEQIARGRLGELELTEPRGEVTLVIDAPDSEASGSAATLSGRRVSRRREGEPDASHSLDEEVDARIDRLLEEGLGSRQAAQQISRAFGLAGREAYRRVLQRRERGRGEEGGG
jgi:16S rRNA (cytidine1402-2'-O)-methyltransferase